MRNLILRGVFLILPFLLVTGTAFSFTNFFSPAQERNGSNTKPEKPPTTLNRSIGSSIEITSSNAGIRINSQNGYLVDVLQRIENETGIRFRVADSLLTARISKDIHASDWDSAIKALLQDFSTIEVWAETISQSRVWLLKSTPYEPGGAETAKRQLANLDKVSESFTSPVASNPSPRRKVMLSENQLRELAKGPLPRPYPPKLFNDLDFRQFFEENGIHSVNDLIDIKKTAPVRKEARKRLLALLQAK